MKPDLVADVGNSRIKWGLCADGRVEKMASLPPDDPDGWRARLVKWQVDGPKRWLVAGVQPATCDCLAEWLRESGHEVSLLGSARQLPLQVALEQPEQVGIDRLLTALAANDRVKRRVSRLIVDAGSAVTVDWVDELGVFRGGAIFPGCHLMAKALHDYTALLPLVKIDWTNPPLPGESTLAAIKAGVFWAAAGGIKALVRRLAASTRMASRAAAFPEPPTVFLTGGDAKLLAPVLDTDTILWPEMTLEGIRIAAEGLA
jgi:type III pantothenate kinase